MQRSVTIWIPESENLVETIVQYNSACNACLKWGFENKTYNKSKIHNATYKDIRNQYPNLQSSLVCAARDQAADMLKREKIKRFPKKKIYSGIRYNARTISISKDGTKVSLSTINGRYRFNLSIPTWFQKYGDGKLCAATMSYQNDKIKLVLNFEFSPVPKTENTHILGIDRGIINPVVTSDNHFFNSKRLRSVKGRYQYLRGKLQQKGTRSAKRKLKRISQKETRFVTNMNHCLSKQIADSNFGILVLEDLTKIRSKSMGKKFNRKLGNWSFAQFSKFLEYKAEDRGKLVIFVDPRYTSQKCSVCGCIEKSNRKGSEFLCKKCQFSLNADLNAARNIAQLGISQLSGLNVNQPIVASC
jgi:IS605 OrfB family transposase